ncbi:MAG: serine/threonine-protein kinase [Tahibacter sp.]
MIDTKRLRELFDAAVQLSGPQRSEFVQNACQGNSVLRRELEQLLDCDNDEDPLAESIAATAADHLDHSAPWIGQRVGNYRVLSELGRGGMGSVFLAERADAEYETRVAIKLIRGFPTREALQRLRRERQLLAGLQHPGIARLLDGGTTESGQPYLVIEFVDGVPLNQWLLDQQADLHTRLLLFQSLCAAVHFAHQNLVVHSDLKPANVLVRADGKPVLLDFGIARLVDAGAGDSRPTELRAFTPDYASPEQLAGGSVSSASDVYALGLLLYEMLCGESYRGVVRSQTGRTRRPSRTALASNQSWLRADAAVLRGDLDHVVAQALQEDPVRRYSSAAALSQDIERYFAGKPLDAVPDRSAYRIGKFLRRHKLASAMTGMLLLAMLGFGWWLAAERAHAVRAEQAARIEADTANHVTDFLLGLFRQADPETARGKEPSVREVLDQGRDRIDAELAGQPVVRARLLTRLGEIYTSIGQPKSSIALLQQAVSLLREPNTDPLALAFGLNELCRAFNLAADYAPARKACEEGLSIRRAHRPPSHPDLGHSYNSLGIVEQEQGNAAAAEENFRKALAIFESAGPESREDLASTQHNLGYAAAHRGDYVAAQRAYAAALTEKRLLFGDAHPRTLNSLLGIANAEVGLGQNDAARRDFEAILALRIKVHGAESIDVARTHNELASLLQDSGELASADAHYAQAQQLYERLLPADALDHAVNANNRATLAEDRGDVPLARSLYQRSYDLRSAKLALGDPARVRSETNFARFLLQTGEQDAARPLLLSLSGVPALRALNAKESFDLAMLAIEGQLFNKQLSAAEQALRELPPPQGAMEFRRRLRHGDALARCLALQKRPVEALAAYSTAIDELTRRLGPSHPVQARAAVTLAGYLLATGDLVQGRERLRVALSVLRNSQVPTSPALNEAMRLAKLVGMPPTG